MGIHVYTDGAAGDETSSLLLEDDGGPVFATRKTWFHFCCCFGVLHGSAVTSMAYASSLQGRRSASAGLGAFFGAYTISALAVATSAVRAFGVLSAIAAGFCGFVLLSTSYVLHDALGGGSVADWFVEGASAVAGASAAVLWVAQTSHYAAAAAQRADLEGSPPADAARDFAALFAAVYVASEALVKLATAGALAAGASLEAAIGFLVLMGAVATAAFLHDPRALGLASRVRRAPDSPKTRGAAACASAHARDARLLWLAPLPVAFGFSSALFTDWVDARVDAARGDAVVGLASTITTVAAGLVCFPLSRAARRGGPRAPVAVAVASYGVLGVALLALGTRDLGIGPLFLLFSLQGVNRALFESSTKFIYVETFRDHPHAAAALASIYFYSGLSSTTTYAMLERGEDTSRRAGAAMLVFAALIALGFAAADRVGLG